MPKYLYKCRECDTYFEDIRTMDERHVPTESACACGAPVGSIFQVLEAPRLVDPIRLRGKLPSGYAQLMKKIQDGSPGSKVYDNLPYSHKQGEM